MDIEQEHPEWKAFCQSCGMPLSKDEDFGTNADGTKSEEYCSMCYLNGKFTQPDITLEEMIEQSAKAIAEYGIMSLDEAMKIAKENIPPLKRWK